jgi:hypothetical protein
LKKKLKRQADALIETLKSVSAQVNALAETFRALADLNDPVTYSPMPKMTYTELATALSVWSRHELGLSQSVNEHMSMFFKYRYQEMSVLKDLLKDRDVYLAAFIKAEERLMARKEKLWVQGDQGKWEIDPDAHLNAQNKDEAIGLMLPKDTSTVQHIKDQYAFYNFQTSSELDRIVRESHLTETKNIEEFVSEHISLVSDLMRTWSSAQEVLHLNRS